MSKWFIAKLNGFAIWVLKITGEWERITPIIAKTAIIKFIEAQKKEEQEKIIPEYLLRAEHLVKDAESIQADGEYKRHQVYARLLKEFPKVPKKELGLAIEIGVNKL